MPRYFYTAKSFQGETKSGTIEAKDEKELARALHQEGFILISAETGERPKKRKFEISLPFFQKVKLAEKMVFTRNLQVMVSAGIPLPRALRILAGQTKVKKFQKALSEIESEVIKGQSFSQGLTRYPDIFSELFVNMIKVGEESGTLEEVLKNLTIQMEREHELKAKIQGALIYPMVIISFMVGIGILMLVMVVPKLAEVFRDLNIDLPATTKMVIFLGEFLAKRWYFAILIVLAAIIILRQILKTRQGKRFMAALFIRLPIISSIIKKANSAQFSRTLSSMITSGVPIVRALEILSGSLSNFYFQQSMRDASEKVRKGGKLSEVLKPYSKIYPSVVLQMLEVGEETGQTSDILFKLADFFEEEVTNTTKNISSIVEPILMILIGVAVGFFAISMIQPMYSMLQAF